MKEDRTKNNKKKKLRKKRVKKPTKNGKGFIDKIIDKIPFELHVPSYQYCGPGDYKFHFPLKSFSNLIDNGKLEKRLRRGDPGINPLDAACKEHDIAYSKHSDSSERYIADKKLQEEAIKRVFAKDSSIGERATALGVAAAMKAKRSLTKIGKGFKRMKKKKKKKSSKNRNGRKSISFINLIKNAKVAIRKSKPEDVGSAIKVAVNSIKKSKKGRYVKTPRIIKLPTYSGGVLPLIPIFAGLSALGSIAGTASSIVGTINKVKNAQKQLDEDKRHNKAMEMISIGKKNGSGFYLSPNKSGRGYFLTPHLKNH